MKTAPVWNDGKVPPPPATAYLCVVAAAFRVEGDLFHGHFFACVNVVHNIHLSERARAKEDTLLPSARLAVLESCSKRKEAGGDEME